MNVVYVLTETPQPWNASEWRCAIPAKAIQRTGVHEAGLINLAEFSDGSPREKKLCAAADLIVIDRHLFGPVLERVQYWKSQGKTVIVDFDAATQLLPNFIANANSNNAHQMNRLIETKTLPSLATQFKIGLRLVDGATVSTYPLANDWQSLTNMQVLPDYIDIDKYCQVTALEHPGTVIGWGGSALQSSGFIESGAAEGLKIVTEARPEVRVVICGDEQLFEDLPVRDSQKVFVDDVTNENWASLLAGFDIGIAPAFGEFGQRMSGNKVLEYLVMKIPWVASEGPAYHAYKGYGDIVTNTPQAWANSLLERVDHLADYRMQAAGAPFLFGISHSIDDHVDVFINTYQRIINKAKA